MIKKYPEFAVTVPCPPFSRQKKTIRKTLRKTTGKTAGQTCGKRITRSISAAFSLVAAVSILALSSPAHASIAYGSINNFDTVNDTGDKCHGFEIEIDDAHSTDITYTYDYNHYGVPKIREDDTVPAHPVVFVRYASAKNADGTWAAYTAVPAGPISPTDGHQFINPSVNFGGEHFGVGIAGAHTAIKYNWLKDDGVGNLIYAGAVIISTPVFTYYPAVGAVAAQVQAEIAPPPEVPVLEFGAASWVKETKTSSHNNKKVDLRDLVSDDPKDPNFKNWKNGEPDEVEVEWQLSQTDFLPGNGGGGNGKLKGAAEKLPKGDEVITRRYDFYKYVGPIDPETGEALASTVGADGVHGIDIYANTVIVGDYVGAQMAGFDAAGKIGLIDHVQDGEINSKYADRSIVIAGTAPIVTTQTGSLPDGMSFNTATGVLSGTPTVTGTFTFTIHSTDAAGGDVSKTFNLTINDVGVDPLPHILVTSKALPAIDGSTSGDGKYDTGTLVTLTATANPGYAFSNWTDGGAIISTSASYSFIAGVNRDVVANFIPANAVTVTTSSSPIADGTTTGGGSYNVSNSVTVVATVNAGFRFVNWTSRTTVVSSSASYTFVVTANRTLVANFASIYQTSLTVNAAQGQVGKSVTLSAVLHNSATNKAVSGKHVQFALDGVNFGSPVTTSSNGTASYKLVVPEETTAGPHAITASFVGDANYASATGSSTLTVAAGAVNLSVSSASGSAGKSVTLSATITNASRIAMVGETISFTVDGVVVGSGTSNAKGKATFSYAIPLGTAKGSHVLVASFSADADHLSASKTSTLTVK